MKPIRPVKASMERPTVAGTDISAFNASLEISRNHFSQSLYETNDDPSLDPHRKGAEGMISQSYAIGGDITQ
jgi:hypothetical protein